MPRLIGVSAGLASAACSGRPGFLSKQFHGVNETIFRPRRRSPETSVGYEPPSDQTMGSIMLALILNAIYRQFLKASLSGAKMASGRTGSRGLQEDRR